MKRLLLAFLAVALFACAAPAWAGDNGPTAPQGGPFTVIGQDLAKMGPPAWLRPSKAPEEDPLVFPQTYIREDQMIAWKIDTADGRITPFADLPTGLTQIMEQAVLIAPAWLRTQLVDRFLELNQTDAQALAELILNPSDDRYTDELAFLVAEMGQYDLVDDNIIDLLEDNVRLIYEHDELLDYVQVVDVGAPGDDEYYTTVQYDVLVDDTIETFELPWEIYYWFIVHPKLDHEQVRYIEPSTGYARSPDNGGKFWRDYYMNDTPGHDSYTTPYFLQTPNVVTEEMLQGWGPTATSYVLARDVHNIDAVFHENGQPVLIEISHPEVNAKGTILFSTLAQEDACFSGDCELLENLVAYGCGDMTLETDDTVIIVADTADKLGTEDLVKNTLTGMGYTDVTIVSVATFLAYDADDLGAIDKIIVPSSQSHDTYDAFSVDPAKGHPELYNWLKNGYRVLELHLSTSADLSDLVFIGGHQVAAPGSGTDTVTLGGRPLLSNVIAAADHIWDGVVYPGVSGNRPFEDDGTMALRILGNWLGKNMMDRVAEYQEKLGLLPSNVDRAIEPVQVLWNHWGNCGEVQDVWSAVLRTCLIPGLNVSDINEDHVWNEFYHDKKWYYLQNDWSNGDTRIATEGGAQDTDYGGGKTTSFIFGWYGNGEIFSVIDRYSNAVTLNVELTDADGRPVPGAKVWIGSEGWGGGSNSWSFFMFTDADGKAQTLLSDGRNYYLRVDSGAGSYPDDVLTHSVKVIADTEAVPDAVFTWDHQFGKSLVGKPTVETSDEQGVYGIHLAFDLHHRFQRLSHAFNGVTFTRFPESLGVNVYVVSDQDMDNCRQGQGAYSPLQAWEGVTEFDEIIVPPADGIWWVVVSNQVNPESRITLDVAAEPVENNIPDDDDDDDDPGDDDDDDNGSGECCGC